MVSTMDKEIDGGWTLITGGSGFLGINMVRKLLEHGETKIRIIDIADFVADAIQSAHYLSQPSLEQLLETDNETRNRLK